MGETLAFLVRDAAHITPDNFDSCVECLRSYTEACLDGGRYGSVFFLSLYTKPPNMIIFGWIKEDGNVASRIDGVKK